MKSTHRILSLLLAALFAVSGCSLRVSEETETSGGASENAPLPEQTSEGGAGGQQPSQTDKGGSAELPPEIVTPVTPVETPDAGEADFLTDGMFIYGDAVYTQAYYSETNSKVYAQTAQYYAQLFGCRTSVVVAPVSSLMIDNPKITSVIADQKDMLTKMKNLTDPSVNFVDVYDTLVQHKSEYLYFRTDHHWTQLGAYYAYTAFASSIGLTPVKLEDMEHTIHNEHYAGSMYEYTMDVKSFDDQIEIWFPTKEHSMTLVTPQGETENYSSSLISFNKTYVTFIAGDNPYTVITVPENPQDFCCLVIKDSFGNAFVPFLVEHYGKIVVIDTRFVDENIYEKYGWMGFDDVIFVNNIEAANSYVWSKMYMAAVGYELP